MHVSRFIDISKGIVHTTITGEITMEGIRADMVRLAADPAYRPDMRGVVDMRNATARLTSDEIMQIAQAIKANPRLVNRTRRALLVSTELLYGLYRMFQAFMADGTIEYRVFRDEQEAFAWLNDPATGDGGSMPPAT